MPATLFKRTVGLANWVVHSNHTNPGHDLSATLFSIYIDCFTAQMHPQRSIKLCSSAHRWLLLHSRPVVIVQPSLQLYSFSSAYPFINLGHIVILWSLSIQQPASLRLRGKQQLPFPRIEVNSDFKGLLAETFKGVQHGEHTYKECTDGFVYVYVHASHDRFNTSEEARGSYVVMYGENHPM